jgi:iron complex outermembrane receptor protein
LTGAGANITTKPGDYLNGPNGQESIRYNLGYEIKVWDDGVVKAHAGYMQDNYWYISPSSTAANDYGGAGTYSAVPSNKSSTDLQIGKPIGTQHYLIAGVSGELATLDKKVYLMNNWRNEDSQTRSLSQANGKTLTKSAYFQDEFTIINPLTLYVGARYDYWTTSGEVSEKAYSFSGTTYTAFDKVYSDRTSMAFSPKASLVYKLDDDTTLRTAWGKSFRTPSLSDMYSGFATATGFSYPNASLKPEKTRSFEVGGEHSFSTGTTIKATYFLTQVSNLIYSYNDNSGNTYKTNAGAEHIQGFEGEVRQKIVGAVYAFANLTNQSATITSNAAVPASVGHTATYAPRVLGNYGIQGDYQDYFGSLLIQHVGKIFNQANNSDSAANVFGANDSYTVVNTKIGWHITDEYTVTAAVGNLLDSKYFNSNAMPGRTFFFGVGAHF